MKISEEMFNTIYNNYSQEIFNIAFGYTRNKSDSDDIVQNVFIKFLQLNKKFNSNLDIKYYLIRMTINESINFLTSYTKKNVLLDNERIMNVPDSNTKEFSYEIINGINKLSEKYKKVIILYYYNSMKIKEIAYVLKTSESAVKKRLERARIAIKDEIERVI